MSGLTFGSGTDTAARDAAIALVGAAVVSAGLLLWAGGDWLLVAAVVSALLTLGVVAWFALRLRRAPVAAPHHDWALSHAVAEQAAEPVALTDRAGRLVCANDAYRTQLSPDLSPVEAMSGDEAAAAALTGAARIAWRDGRASPDPLTLAGRRFTVAVQRAGEGEDVLVWQLSRVRDPDLTAEVADALGGELGDRLGRAGGMAVLLYGNGQVRAATRAWSLRATGDLVTPAEGQAVAGLLRTEPSGVIRFAKEGPSGPPLRLLHVPLDEGGGDAVLFAVDEMTAAGAALPGGSELDAITRLIDRVPMRLALVDRDGRLLAMNTAFADFVGEGASARYPGDLVVTDDKGALADHIRRMSGARASSGDLAVRFAAAPDEPVTATVSSLRGLGPVAVLLSLRDDAPSLPARTEVSQQNKMEAVGHLAGGVAHDFNNLLTAILGVCDLMLMRHVPGDPDFDDIQQIRANSNRAASLTRHLLAFSRQQTLRPQVVQLPDLLGEVTHLLKRLLGERIVLTVDHARQQGAVRVDAQQLEQVVVNLAVNARDAMPDGGTLTIETFAVGAREVREMGDKALPVGDYTALQHDRHRRRDSGRGAAQDLRPVLHHEGAGKGHRLGTVHLLRNHPPVGRIHRG